MYVQEEARRCRAWMSAIVSAMGETPEALDQTVRDFLHIDGGLLTVSVQSGITGLALV